MRPGEPFISSSMMDSTVSSSVCAGAPGYVAETTIEGGATVGYCEIGSLVTDTAPSTRMKSAITQAKTGRSMKNLDIERGPLLLRAGGGRVRGRGRGVRRARSRPGHRLHRRAGAQLLEAVDHHH